MSKLEKPYDETIFTVAVNFASVWFEAARSSGYNLTDANGNSYKNNTARFARENLEKFIPHAINHMLELLKPTSNCTEHMRMKIYEAIMGYNENLNPMELPKSILPEVDFKSWDKNLKAFEKNKPKFEIITNKPTEKKTVLHR